RANFKARSEVGKTIFANRHRMMLCRNRRVRSEEFLLSCRRRIGMGLRRRDLPIAVIKEHLEGIAPSFAEMSDCCAIGIGDGMPLVIQERSGEIAIVNPPYIELRGGAIAIRERRQIETGIFMSIERGIVSRVFVQDAITGGIEGLLQEPFIHTLRIL